MSIYRNPSISIKALLSIVNTQSWEPLDIALTAKVTGARKHGATACFRRMLGIKTGPCGPHYQKIIGEVMIDNVEGVRVARCYDVFVKRTKPTRGGHRFFWRIFPMSTTDTEILDSARSEVSARAFLREPAVDQSGVVWPKAKQVENACAEVPASDKPIISLPPPKYTDVGEYFLRISGPAGMSDNDLIAKIKALRTDLEALEAERDRRVQHAADLIAKLKG